MADWKQILDEIKSAGSTHDVIRRRYLQRLQKHTGRNVIVYYSGWLQKPGVEGSQVNDADKNGFMAVIKGLDRSKGLDLLLHTPGGETAATESLVDYLRAMFGTDIRAFVPQLAMSAGTMIACAAKVIFMGKHSSLGPIDPQFRGIPAHGVVEEFATALASIKADPAAVHLWQPIIAHYGPTFIGECQKAIVWSNEMVTEWLVSGMFAGRADPAGDAAKAIAELGDHALTKSHARHLGIDRVSQFLEVVPLESDQKLQDAVLSVHHTMIHTLSATPAYKIIENHKGQAFIQMAQVQLLKA